MNYKTDPAFANGNEVADDLSAPENRKYPYLLRAFEIERPNQVWTTDITDTALEGKRAFVIAIIDLFSCRVMDCRITNTMEASGCVEV